MPPVIDLTVVNWVIYGIVGYYLLLWLLSLSPRRPVRGGLHRVQPVGSPLMVVVVPALDEELVLDTTLDALTRLDYAGPHRVLVVDDGSRDATGVIAAARAFRDPRIRVATRIPPEARQGKSETLNHAYRVLCSWLHAGDTWFAGHASTQIVVVILDADGVLAPGALDAVAPYFTDPQCASVQIGVRIGNARANWLARMQDIEFVGFTAVVQVARDWIGSSGLGGNGQFTRLNALDSLGAEPWRRGALTEDLDLGLRLVVAGWRTRFCHTTHVVQQGVEAWRPLLRQRTRWIQGHYQCWRYLPALAFARRAPWTARLDLALYLLLVTTVLLISLVMLGNGLGLLGLATVHNESLGTLTGTSPGIAIQAAISLVLLVIFLGTYQRTSTSPFRWYQLPVAGIAFTLYGYLWLLVSLRSLWRLVTRQQTWVKTARVANWNRAGMPPIRSDELIDSRVH